MKQTGEFCEYCVSRNYTIVQVLFRTGKVVRLLTVKWFAL